MWQEIKDKKNILIPTALVFIAAMSFLGWWTASNGLFPQDRSGKQAAELQGATEQGTGAWTIPAGPEGTISLNISYPSDNGILVEQRNIQYNALPVRMAEIIMTEYLKGLKNDMKDAKLLGIYRDKDNVLYIDLSGEFVGKFPGGARQEYYLMKSIYDTLVGNIAGTADVKLLIEGKEIESVGGHFNCLDGLKEIAAN